MWARIFASNAAEVLPSVLLAHLESLGLVIEGHFKGDDLGWTSGKLLLPRHPESPVTIERYLTETDALRDDLNSWAAGLEASLEYAPQAGPLMERTIRTQQLFTLHRPIDHSDEVMLDRVIEGMCQYLATQREGFYQIDGKGFYDADGSLVVQEY